MPVLSGLGHNTFIEFDTSIEGVTACLRGRAEVNLIDCRSNPRLNDELFARCRAALDGLRFGKNGGRGALAHVTSVSRPVAPFVYQEEPLDTWQTFGIMAERAVGQSIVLDCDCVSPVWAAFFWRRLAERLPVGLGVSQPKTRVCCHDAASPCKGAGCAVTPAAGKTCRRCGYGMAHAFTVVGYVPGMPDLLRRLLVPMPGEYVAEIRDERGRRRLWRGRAGAFDGSVFAGMPAPRPSFYGSGESAVAWLRPDLRLEDVSAETRDEAEDDDDGRDDGPGE